MGGCGWWLRVILVLSFGLSKAEQKEIKKYHHTLYPKDWLQSNDIKFAVKFHGMLLHQSLKLGHKEIEK